MFRPFFIYFVLPALASSFANFGYAQQELSGKVVATSSGKSIPFVTIRILETDNLGDQIADSLGNFRVKAREGERLIFSAIGFQHDTIVVAKTMPPLLTVQLTELTGYLQEVRVVGKMPIRQEVDKLIYDVTQDPEAQHVSGAQLLPKIPLLHLTNGGLSIVGRSPILVLVNGKRHVVAERNVVQYLESIPANRMETVEVMPFVPEKYRNDGYEGVINITLKKEDMLYGYETSLTAGVQLPGTYKGSALADVSNRKFGFTFFGGYNETDAPPMDRILTRSQLSDGQEVLLQQTQVDRWMRRIHGALTMTYDIGDIHGLTADVHFGKLNGNEFKTQQTRLFLSSGTASYSQTDTERFPETNLDARLNYQLVSQKDKNRKLQLFYRYVQNQYEQDNVLNPFEMVNITIPSLVQNNEMTFDRHAAQIDYSYPKLFANTDVETGVKSIVDHNNNEAWYAEAQTEATDFTNNRQRIYSWYGTALLRKSKWSLKTSLSMEHTDVNTDFISEGVSAISSDSYFSWLPTVLAQYSINRDRTLNFSFEKNILRPSILQLNNFVDRQNAVNLQSGNPALQPANHYRYGINYQLMGKSRYRFGYEYSEIRNAVQLVMDDNGDGVIRRYFENSGKVAEHIGTLYSNWQLMDKKINISSTMRVVYRHIEGLADNRPIERGGWTGGLISNSSYSLSSNWRMSCFLNLSLPRIYLQQESNFFHSSSFELSKNYPKQKLRITASVLNPFTRHQYLRSYSDIMQVNQVAETRNIYRFYSISLNYRFGRLKRSVDHIETKIKSDNLMTDQLKN